MKKMKPLSLKYHPMPIGKRKREHIVGEAFLKHKGVVERDLITLKNVDVGKDPPDLVCSIKGFGELKIEVTENIPHDRVDEVRRFKFIERLRFYLNRLGTRPAKPSDIYFHKEGLFPILKPKDVEKFALEIDNFFKRDRFLEEYRILRDICKEPVKIRFAPAFYPTNWYDSNIFICDTTGYPIDEEKAEQVMARITKKKEGKSRIDILIIHQDFLGLSHLEQIFGQTKDLLLSVLPFQGIYILTFITRSEDYWVNLITIREHPIFQ